MRLLINAGAGNGQPFQLREALNPLMQHLYTLFVWGTFGGATVTFEISFDQVEWFAVTGVTVTAKTVINVEFKARFCRAVVTGGAGPSIQAFLN